jgi:hypothetical protein
VYTKFWSEKVHGNHTVEEGLGPRVRLDILEKTKYFSPGSRDGISYT